MAQAPSRKTTDEQKRSDAIEEALRLWRSHAETYRTAIFRYKFLAAERRRLKITPLATVSERVLKEYPNIPLFFCLDETSAREYLESLDLATLLNDVRSIDTQIQFNYAYRTIVVKAIEFCYRQKNPKASYCHNYVTGGKCRKNV